MPLHPPIFPIDQPVMPEERQIGRRGSIDALEARIDAAVHQWLIGPRRIGKTSVAKAALARLRAMGAVALDVDLSKLAISSSEALAGEIARQASAARVGVVPIRRRLREVAGRRAPDTRRLATAVSELGFDDEGAALAAVSSLLAAGSDGAPGLGRVMEALALHARVTGERIVVLLDEVHLLAELDGSEVEVARWAREPDGPIVFVFAGSEESAVRALRERRRPLAHVGQELHLDDITTSDWLHGLRDRFGEAGMTVSDHDLFALVEASDGHPRRTMLIATHLRSFAESRADRVVTGSMTRLAIDAARQDRAWT